MFNEQVKSDFNLTTFYIKNLVNNHGANFALNELCELITMEMATNPKLRNLISHEITFIQERDA